MRNSFAITSVIVASLLATVSLGYSDEPTWGTITGQIRLVGDLPKLPPLVRGVAEVPDERLVVDPETRGIANIAIYLVKKPSAVHPSLEKSAVEKLTFTQTDRRFVPHVMFVRNDQEIRAKSDDPGQHNVHTSPFKNSANNFMLAGKEDEVVIRLKIPEKLPVKVTSDIAPWMAAYWLVLDHPYAAVTDSEGNFEIPNLPVGTHEFIMWQESAGYLAKKYIVEVNEGLNPLEPEEFRVEEFLK